MDNSNNPVIDKLMSHPKIKNLGLKRGAILTILKAYNDVAFEDLLDKGHVELGNGLNIEIIQILDRLHVLRGVPYKSTRKYKLKLTMDDPVYRKIEEYYNKLQEDIL